MSLVLDVEQPGCCDRAPKNRNRLLGGQLSRSLRIHTAQCTQDFLVMLESLAFARPRSHEKLAPVTIHEAIRNRRTELRMSMQELADAVSASEGLAKNLGWQTVQQWENGKTAPKRTRLEHVAKALKTTPEALLRGESAPSGQPDDVPRPPGMSKQAAVLAWRLSEIGPIARQLTVIAEMDSYLNYLLSKRTEAVPSNSRPSDEPTPLREEVREIHHEGAPNRS